MKLLSASTSCGCTVAGLSASTLRPDARGSLTVGVRTGVEPGKRSALVHLTTNDPNRPFLEVPIRWTVRAPWSFAPAALDLGLMRPGETATREVGLELGEELWRAEVHAEAGPPSLTGVWKGAGPKRTFAVTLAAGEVVGNHTSTVVFRVKGRDGLISILPVRWEVYAPVRVAPASLFTSNARPGEILEASLVVSAPGGAPFAVRAVEPDGLDLIDYATASPAESARHVVKVRVRSPERAGTHRGSLVVRHTLAGVGPAVAVPWSIILPESERP